MFFHSRLSPDSQHDMKMCLQQQIEGSYGRNEYSLWIFWKKYCKMHNFWFIFYFINHKMHTQKTTCGAPPTFDRQ